MLGGCLGSWAYLRLHHLLVGSQLDLPAKLMGEQGGSRFAAILLEAKQITEFELSAVPIETLENLEGHGAGMVIQPLTWDQERRKHTLAAGFD